MSRVEIQSKDGRYTFAFGVDHVMSTFFQVHDRQIDDEDEACVVEANNTGVVKSSEYHTIPSRAKPLVAELESAFEASRLRGVMFPNIDSERIQRIAHAFGVEIDKSMLYQILD